MKPDILLSGSAPDSGMLIFRVYAAEIPETERKQAHRAEHFAALELLSAALKEDFGVTHAAIRRTGLEKPRLLHRFLHMNLSHCKGLAVCAVGRLPLGVDAEAPRAVKPHLLQKVCTAAETAEILAADDPEKAFSRRWTLKEAYAKLTGAGIRTPFDRLAFSLADGIRFLHPDAGRLRFFQMTRPSSHIISLCLPDGSYTVQAGSGMTFR